MLTRIGRTVYGIFASAIFLAVMGVVCLLIIIGPTLAIRRATGRWGIRLAFLAIGCPIITEGFENLPAGAAICVSNHSSYVDGLVLTAALPARYHFLVQSGAAKWPVVGVTIRRMGVHFVNRGAPREAAAVMKALLKGAKTGESYTIFAEGTFERDPGLLPFQSGAFLIASRAGVPIAPTVIQGTRRILPDGAKLFWHSVIRIKVLPALTASGEGREAANALRDATRAAILCHCGEPDAKGKAEATEAEPA